ncbi:DUF6712 family protein [Xanthocytophaga flava]|uniref:DUF6712 family protein n=1 Tax=Xanthocytophaga flava TaxID=3048013 RepID=UPI0028D5CBC3|nr:DUF6712 family protein [Xanthocytophaga flavus]MDJ1472838.1 hypothetical protein [Xanthocytophaga flavus]
MKYLFKNTKELTPFVKIHPETNFESLKPELAWAQRSYIVKYLGSDQYEDLLAAYNSTDPLSDDNLALLEKIQPALANLTIAHFVTTGQVTISQLGVMINSDQTKKTAFQWQKEEVSRELFHKGFNLLEDVLKFLESKKDVFTLWKNQSYTVFKEFLINDAVTFSTHYQIQDSRRLFLAMRPAMKKVEIFTISQAISTGLLDKIKAKIKDDSINGTADTDLKYKSLLELIQPAVANLTISRSLLELPIVIQQDTVFLNEIAATEGKTEKAPSIDLLAQLRDQTYQDGMAYLDMAVSWLKANATETLFEDFYNQFMSTSSSGTNQAGKRIYGAF